MADYVLGHFSKEDLSILKEGMEKVDGAVELMLNGNIDEAMNRYNTKVSR